MRESFHSEVIGFSGVLMGSAYGFYLINELVQKSHSLLGLFDLIFHCLKVSI
jgi:hypothetical protein